jgi:hypothetical protein
MKWWANRSAHAANWNTPAEQQRAMFRMQMTIGAIAGVLLYLNLSYAVAVRTSLPLLLVLIGAFYFIFRKSKVSGFFVGMLFGFTLLFMAGIVGRHLQAMP